MMAGGLGMQGVSLLVFMITVEDEQENWLHAFLRAG